jgi:hypothetical protein
MTATNNECCGQNRFIEVVFATLATQAFLKIKHYWQRKVYNCPYN